MHRLPAVYLFSSDFVTGVHLRSRERRETPETRAAAVSLLSSVTRVLLDGLRKRRGCSKSNYSGQDFLKHEFWASNANFFARLFAHPSAPRTAKNMPVIGYKKKTKHSEYRHPFLSQDYLSAGFAHPFFPPKPIIFAPFPNREPGPRLRGKWPPSPRFKTLCRLCDWSLLGQPETVLIRIQWKSNTLSQNKMIYNYNFIR